MSATFAEGSAASSNPSQGQGEAAVPSREYTIDDLAAATGVPSRTIRFYQAKGALPPPSKKGRVAFYDDSHAERLRLVAHLQDKGLSLRAIRELFQRTESGDVSVSEWLGVGEQLSVPWSDDRPRVCSEAELLQILGGPARPGLISDLLRMGLIRREPGAASDAYFVASPGLLQIAFRLEAAGVELDTAHAANEILRRQIARAADELVVYFVKRVEDASGPDDVVRSLGALRAVGADAVKLVFAQEVERALREAIEEGRVLPPARRKKRG